MSDSPSFADLTRRLDLALTVDLIATPTPLHLSSSPDVEIVRQQMAQTGFDILPCDNDITSCWGRPSLLFADGEAPRDRPQQRSHTLLGLRFRRAGHRHAHQRLGNLSSLALPPVAPRPA